MARRLLSFAALVFVLSSCDEEPPPPDFGEMSVSPETPLSSSGPTGGPFEPERASYTISADIADVRWEATTDAPWIDLVPSSGVATPDTPSVLTVAIGLEANALAVGNHSAQIRIRNLDDEGNAEERSITLEVTSASGIVMTVTPDTDFVASGEVGGVFSPSERSYTVRATGGAFDFEVTTDVPWLEITPATGMVTLSAAAQVRVRFNDEAAMLGAGSHMGVIEFKNLRTGEGNTTRMVSVTTELAISLRIRPATPFASSGDVGGPFDPPSGFFRLDPIGAEIEYQVVESIDWLDVSPKSGVLTPGGAAGIIDLVINSNANALPQGNHIGVISFNNLTNGRGSDTRQVILTIALVPEPFDLIAPNDGAANASLTPDFSWGSSLGAGRYRLEIATDNAFANVVERIGGIQDTMYTLETPLSEGTSYFWRVTAINNLGETVATNAPFTFTTGGPPGPFDLTTPANAATDVSLTPTFTWSASTNATEYALTVASDAALTNVVETQAGITQTSAALMGTLTAATTYYWQVSAMSPAGSADSTNGPLSFTTVAAPAPFNLAGPQNGANEVAFPVQLSWTDANNETSYDLEIATDAAFTNIIHTAPGLAVDTTTYDVPQGVLTFGQTYYWRVASNNANGTSLAGNAPFSFSVQYSWRSFGGGAQDELLSAAPSGMSFAFAGSTASNDPALDFAFGVLGPSGTVNSARTVGGGARDVAESTAVGPQAVFVGGTTESAGAGNRDAWILRLTATGTIAWDRVLGDTGIDEAHSIDATTDQGVVAAGGTTSFGAGGEDAFVVKLDATGGIDWATAFGGPQDDTASAVIQSPDGGYVVVGASRSGAGADSDVVVWKLDALGAITWQNAYGGAADDDGFAVVATNDGGYVVAAQTSSFSATTPDLWLFKLGAGGALVWQQRFDANGTEMPIGLTELTDGSLAVIGTSGTSLLYVYASALGVLLDARTSPSATGASVLEAGAGVAIFGSSQGDAFAARTHLDGSPFGTQATLTAAQTTATAVGAGLSAQAAAPQSVSAGLLDTAWTTNAAQVAP